MKKVIFLAVVISFIIGSCTQIKKSPIEGAWKIISIETVKGDTVTNMFPGNYTGSEQLVFSKNHFLWVGNYKKDSTSLDNFGGGTFTLTGNRLEESIFYSVSKKMVETKIKLQWELKNDTATQTWPLDENWQISKDGYNIQKWIRLEPK